MAKQNAPLHALRAFDAVARHLSYTKAAQELGVSPAAVKQNVVRLEKAVGAKLIERKGHSLTLTEIGKAGEIDVELAMRFVSEAFEKMWRLAE